MEEKEAVKWKDESLQATRQKAETDLNMETDGDKHIQSETHGTHPCSHMDSIHLIVINYCSEIKFITASNCGCGV